MIVKSYELDKTNISKYNFFLFYGKNEGLQNELINKYFITNFEGQINKYEESEFINKKELIIAELLNKSLFDDQKIIIISRVSDKVFKLIEELNERDLTDIKIILKSGVLEKRSKLRNLFEKNKSIIVVATYEDLDRNLSSIIIKFLNEHKIKISRESINLIISRASGNRQNLNQELDKILNYSLTEKNISYETIQKLSNLSENYDVSELANSYLSKNTKNVAKIFNENSYSDEDCILILRTLLNKTKKLADIIYRFNETNNLDEVISSTKPPIFWKDREIVKIQAKSWRLNDLKNKVYEINDIEAKIKTNAKNSLNIISDFFVNY